MLAKKQVDMAKQRLCSEAMSRESVWWLVRCVSELVEVGACRLPRLIERKEVPGATRIKVNIGNSTSTSTSTLPPDSYKFNPRYIPQVCCQCYCADACALRVKVVFCNCLLLDLWSFKSSTHTVHHLPNTS